MKRPLQRSVLLAECFFHSVSETSDLAGSLTAHLEDIASGRKEPPPGILPATTLCVCCTALYRISQLEERRKGNGSSGLAPKENWVCTGEGVCAEGWVRAERPLVMRARPDKESKKEESVVKGQSQSNWVDGLFKSQALCFRKFKCGYDLYAILDAVIQGPFPQKFKLLPLLIIQPQLKQRIRNAVIHWTNVLHDKLIIYSLESYFWNN